MERPWQPEREVDAALARSLIEAQFPELAGERVEPFGVGWDNTGFLVGGRLVFRFPRRQIAVPAIEAEANVLPGLAGRLPLPVPDPIHVGQPTAEYPWPFIGYAMLPGRTACTASLTDEQRALAAPTIAEFLAALHGSDAGAAPRDSLERASVPRRMGMVTERLAKLRELALVDDARPFERILADAPAEWTPRDDALCHGDFYARHLLVDDGGRPAGVIDWGDVHRGDPAVDLGIAHGFLPPAALDAFYAGYGDVSDVQLRFARFRALHYAVILPIYGHDVGDDALVREGLTALRYLRG